jgi:predicted acyltransferase (DUF342 family)
MKYKFTEESIKVDGVTLFRIEALRNIPFHGVKAGDKGGFIEKESNLSQKGNAWVSGDARVYEDAQVRGYAHVYENASVFGGARIGGIALIYGNAMIYGRAKLGDDWEVFGDVEIYMPQPGWC